MKGITVEDFLSKFKNQQYVEQLKRIPQEFNVKHNEKEKITEITIYGVIGSSWFSDSFSAKDIDTALKNAGTNDIIINLNSPGGSAFDGIAIFNRLKRHEGKVIVHVDGWACSAASIIAMAGDEIIMNLGSMMMIHEASSVAFGSKANMRKEAEVLEQLEDGIIDIYMTKTKLNRDEVREKIEAETWMSANKAVELGFADTSLAKGENEDDNNESVGVTNELTDEDKKNILHELNNVLKKETIIQNETKRNILSKFKRH